jgi:hypothetical protein
MEMFIPRVHTKHENRRTTPVFASLGAAIARVKGVNSVKSGGNRAKE